MEPQTTLVVDDLVAATPQAYTALWRTLLGMDNVVTVSAGMRPVDEPLGWFLLDGRAIRQRDRSDFTWLRVLDVPAALEARRYSVTGRVVLEVVDPMGFAAGRWALDGGPDGATCARTDASADLTVPVTTLGSIYLGGYRLRTLAGAGLASEHTPGALATADAMFAGHVAPWCNTEF
jgi:predicted acetyltransferase